MRAFAFFLVAASLAACSGPAPAAAKPECAGVPPLTERVLDKADLLSPAAERKVTGQLGDLEARTRDQLIVVTLPDLGGRRIEDVGLQLGRCWGVGQKELDNGVLLVVARDDRKLRIEVGYGLENLLRDEVAGEIIRGRIAPLMAKGQYEQGVQAGVDAIEAVLLSNTRRPQRLPARAKG